MTDYTLALDAAAANGTVALLKGRDLIVAREVALRRDEEDRLMPAVAACCDDAGVAPRDLARVVCGAGPGSFTSLRIASSLAKGIATGTACPLYAVPSLMLTVAAALPDIGEGSYLSVLDAYRGELFALFMHVEGMNLCADGPSFLVLATEAASIASDRRSRVIGPGQEIDAGPHASGVSVVLSDVLRSGPVDLVKWEPDYGRAPEAQVRWERAHGRPLPV